MVESGAAQLQGVEWNKIPCRFCGTGCSALVGTKDGTIVSAVDWFEGSFEQALGRAKQDSKLVVLDGDSPVTPFLGIESLPAAAAAEKGKK